MIISNSYEAEDQETENFIHTSISFVMTVEVTAHLYVQLLITNIENEKSKNKENYMVRGFESR